MVYIIQIIDIFAPPPFFQNEIISPKYSENFLFSLFFPPIAPYIRVFT